MNHSDRLESMYAQALHEHLTGGGDTALRRAYELGCRAMAEGRTVRDLIAAHDGAAKTVLNEPRLGENMMKNMEAMHSFLLESLSPFESVHRSYRETNAALHRLNESLEEETRRIAHVLHDDARQLLAAVHISLADLARDLPSPVGERVREIRGLLDQIEKQLRRLSHDLRPTILDDLGLLPALEFLSQNITERTGLAVIVEGSTGGRLHPSAETTLYRIVQQGLLNVAKHAHASRAMVRLSRESGVLQCAIRDNGIGFDVRALDNHREQRGIGLITIRERVKALGGTLEINSSRQLGTELLIKITMED